MKQLINGAIIQGVLILVEETQQVTPKFTKRAAVIQTTDNPQYPEKIKVEAFGNGCSIFDSVSEGEMVEVHVNIRGREWQNKEGVTMYFNTLNAWRVNPIVGQKQAYQGDLLNTPQEGMMSQEQADEANDDLPF